MFPEIASALFLNDKTHNLSLQLIKLFDSVSVCTIAYLIFYCLLFDRQQKT